MVFSTIIFLCVFLPLTILIYYLMPGRAKNYFLLLASLMFYAWGEPRFVFVMLASIVCNYIFGMLLGRAGSGAGGAYASGGDNPDGSRPRAQTGEMWRRKLILALAVSLNLGILFVFKYLTFGMENLHRLVPALPVWQIALPIGISFYTFQGMSYVIDVYRERELAQRNPFKLALYISMFPQLIAGPIVRYKDIRESLDARKHTMERFADGAGRFIIGLSKKAILANMTGQLADAIQTGDFSVMSAAVAWLGAIAYTLQIYFDFSGYSDMAIGLGKIFGFDFLENFNYPYISTSIREFWRRWHISLSGWFRDYLYIPMGGSRRGNVYLHLLIVFLATGIWHGAAWGFLFWGLWHGFFILLERFFTQHAAQASMNGAMQVKERINKGKDRENQETEISIERDAGDSREEHKLPESNFCRGRTGSMGNALRKLAKWAYTMLVVIIGWVLFSLVDVKDFLTYLSVMFGANAGQFYAYGIRYYLSNQMIFYMAAAALACIPWREVIAHLLPVVYDRVFVNPSGAVYTLQKLLLLALLVLCFLFIINSSYNPFIYFRF